MNELNKGGIGGFGKLMMISPAKILIYLIELINSYASIYYSNFLFFYLQRTFGFGEKENLLTAALCGFYIYYRSLAGWQTDAALWGHQDALPWLLRGHFVPCLGPGIHYPNCAGHGVLFVDSGDLFYLAGP
jgi:hypothetical protein